MPRIRKVACLVVPVLVCLASAVSAQQKWCYANATMPALAQVSLCNLPNGMGWSLTQAKAIGSLVRVNATITLELRDANDLPVIGVPSEDLWLETTFSGLVLCLGGSMADAPTNDLGLATWSHSLRAGGQSDRAAGEKTRVMINWPRNSAIACEWLGNGNLYLDILHNSPDIDGNLVVNLSDTVLFAQDYKSGAYRYRSDFLFDGALNLSDVVLHSWGVGASCP